MPVSLSALEIAFSDAFFIIETMLTSHSMHTHFSNTLLYSEFVGSVDSRCTSDDHNLLNCHTKCT